MITVMKASAGSGKTYALAKKYIDMLLASKDPQEYSHILAVTFTNKATEEMKGRIIQMLSENPSPRASQILCDILHDYGSFYVSTIDKFFQQTLRAFARELGQFNRYQVELDKNSLVDEAVDTILDELDANDKDDMKMINFIVQSMEEKVSEGGSLNIEEGLKMMARQLKSESFSRKCSELEMDKNSAYGQEQLSDLKTSCRNVIRKYEESVRDAAQRVTQACSAAGLTYGDFSRGWIAQIDKFHEWNKNSGVEPTDAFMRKLHDPSAENWFNKSNQGLFGAAFSAVGGPLADFLSLWSEDGARMFKTACMLQDQIYGLGVAARLFRTFDRVTREKNVVCLDESNSLLRDIIDGSDAPFVYEKTGVRFRTFLLDEFQDTSSTQWENFKPLLEESQAGKSSGDDHTFDDLIVGDVKQSIYRWRESDWGLLDHEVENSFPDRIWQNPLECNWRSLQNIIDFNNALYPELAKSVDDINPVPEGLHSVSEIYDGCFQKPGKGESQQGGCVDVEFLEDSQAQLEKILETINEIVNEHGGSYGDIGILVRKKASGTDIAQYLIENSVPVVTDASLRIKNSLSVRRLVAMMSYVDNPDDKVGAYVAQQYGVEGLPDSYHSLASLVESLYIILCNNADTREDCLKEVMYITSFMDHVMDYSAVNGNNLREFLSHWQEVDPDVNTAGSDGAVRIITIHKSKGLAFPYVIIPFAEKITLYDNKKTKMWAVPEGASQGLEQFCDRLYYVHLNADASGTCFKRAYSLERFNQGVDAINLLYVATTRAKGGMKILASISGKNPQDSAATLLYGYCGGQDLHIGNMPDFALLRDKDDAKNPVSEIGLTYACHHIKDRLSIRPYAADFFTESADAGFDGLSYRERGIVLHDILGHISYASDLDSAVEAAVADGSLPAQSSAKVREFLGRRIASRPEFFPQGARILMESSLIDLDGQQHRPDRVIIYPDGRVVIVDYKFGAPKDDYIAQIECYRNLFIQMGYKDVSAHLWFVYNNKLI